MLISDEYLSATIKDIERDPECCGEDFMSLAYDLRDLRKLARALLQKLPFYSCGCSSMESTKALKAHLEEKP